MTQPSPADTLRAAADKLRELTPAASPGPWAMNQWGNVETARHEEIAEVWPLNSVPDTNARYIAAMHPGVGTALAQLLGAAVEHVEMDVMCCDHGAHQCPDFAGPALAVARAILGDQP
ncbi:hypothetical protein [Streptomyces showdoensis]|uniref:Uncharacterized protein n=1 Tax=Streptomyces showdoensis TaxID=68268 RepID=A0A2P2GTP6_STREW|nr:hypothetical protein [Streptomyces showdoensis]KKZ74870.1 hypothetical protein VO63_05320 [Streptomyces showdoensis]